MRIREWILAAGVLLAAGAGRAQTWEFGGSAGGSFIPGGAIAAIPDAGTASGLSNVSLGNGFRAVAHATVNMGRRVGNEFGYAYSRTPLTWLSQGANISIQQGYYSLLLYLSPKNRKVRAFGAAGGNFSTFSFPVGPVVTEGGITKPGFNAGGGVKIRTGPRYLVRFDYREFYCATPPYFGSVQFNRHSLLRHTAVTAGFSFLLGETPGSLLP